MNFLIENLDETRKPFPVTFVNLDDERETISLEVSPFEVMQAAAKADMEGFENKDNEDRKKFMESLDRLRLELQRKVPCAQEEDGTRTYKTFVPHSAILFDMFVTCAEVWSETKNE